MSASIVKRHETGTTPLSIIDELRLSIRSISKSSRRLIFLLLLESEDKRRYSLLGDFLPPSYLHFLFVIIGVIFQVILYDLLFLVSSYSIQCVLGMS